MTCDFSNYTDEMLDQWISDNVEMIDDHEKAIHDLEETMNEVQAELDRRRMIPKTHPGVQFEIGNKVLICRSGRTY